MNAAPLIRSALLEDQRQLFRMLEKNDHHRHLDWREPLSWIDVRPFNVLEFEGRLIAALACPVSDGGVLWLRLFICQNMSEVQTYWQLLWQSAVAEINKKGRYLVAAIAMQDWMIPLLEGSGFAVSQDLVMLACNEVEPMEGVPSLPGVDIRPMITSDLPGVVDVDHAAFLPLWHNSFADLALAHSKSLLSAVAEAAGQVVGYHISTRSSIGVHLARLATHPRMQERGIGQALITDLMTRAGERGIGRFTVNTQGDNIASLKLYTRLGFHETGERYPVYTCHVAL